MRLRRRLACWLRWLGAAIDEAAWRLDGGDDDLPSWDAPCAVPAPHFDQIPGGSDGQHGGP